MFKSGGIKIVGLVLVTLVVLGGGIYATAALVPGGASADTLSSPTVSALAAPTEATPATEEWRLGMLEMLEDHMGLTGAEAEHFADEMIEHMRGFDEDFDFHEMLDWCTRLADEGEYGAVAQEWRLGMLEMLQDHMGLSQQAAEEFADEMAQHMQSFDEDLGIQEMLDWCTERAAEGEYGPGVMGGYGMMGGNGWRYDDYGMMDEDDSAYGSYGMRGGMMEGYYSFDQGWHMMYTVSLPETGSADQAAAAPTAPLSQQKGYEPGYRSAPGGMMGTTTTGNGSTPEDPGMMGEAPSLDTVPSTQSGTTPATPTPTAPDSQAGGFGPGSPGMMGGGMMGSGMMGR